jgi:hypothetical protein
MPSRQRRSKVVQPSHRSYQFANPSKKDLRQFAITGNLPSRGKAPRKEDKKWYPVYDNICSCPLTKSKALGAGKAQPTFLPPPKCTCGWIHQTDTAAQLRRILHIL